MKRIRLKHLSPLIGLALFVLALTFLSRTLGENSYRDILRQIAVFPPGRILGALGLVFLSYTTLGLYDHLALRYLGRHLGRLRVSLASFISYAFSRNLGFAVLTGGSVRYRFYSAWGLSAEEIARLIGFAAGTFSLGLMTMGGGIAVQIPSYLPELPQLPLGLLRPVGLLALAAVIVYLLLVRFRNRPLRLRGWEIPMPRPRQALAQVFVGCLDWFLTACVLYYLLAGQAPLSLFQFLEIYLLAQLAVIISHVPGGLGVFETVILLLVPGMEAPDLLAILVVYRAIYFLLPFGVAVLLFGVMEALQHRRTLRRAGTFLGHRLAVAAPPVLAGAALMAGALLLFTGATPTGPARLQWLQEHVPLPLLELSHLAAGLAGAGLLLFSRGLQLRLRSAYHFTLALLGAGILLALLRGMSYEQAVILGLMLIAFVPFRSVFYRQVPLVDEPFPLGWTAVILLIFGASAWLVFFSYRDIPLPQALWSFSFGGESARSLRAELGVAAVLVVFAIARGLRPRAPEPRPPTATELAKAREIVERHGTAAGKVALSGPHPLLFSRSGGGFLMYRTQGRSWIGLGDPIGPPAERQELAWCLQEISERHGGWPVFLLAGPEMTDTYLEMGLVLQPMAHLGPEVAPLLLEQEDAGPGQENRRPIQEQPDLERQYLAFPGEISLSRILADVSRLPAGR